MRALFLSLVAAFFVICSSTRASAEIKFDGVDDRYTPVVIPNGSKLPWRMVDGVKVFQLVVEEFEHEFAPGLKAKVWGYNGQLPGPAIEVVEGDKVRIYVTNKLPESTTVHWHGIILPNGMDGVSGLTQSPIKPGDTYKYEFTLKQHGTQMYHSHFDEMTQIGIGTTGLFIVHPKVSEGPKVDRDFALMLGEWKIKPGTSRPDPMEMVEFNLLTFNGSAFPATEPLVVKRGERVKIRVANLSAMSHHPIHLHGYQFKIVETDGGQIPESAQQSETTVLTPAGSTRSIEFVANEPGDWALHCHMTHHIMNQMGHGLPNMIGVDVGDLDKKITKILPDYMTMGEAGMGDHAKHMKHMEIPENSIPMLGAPGPFSHIDMGGMFTILKVREGITSYNDPGWYQNPAGTVASSATQQELQADLGIVSDSGQLNNKTHDHEHHH